MKRIVVAAGLAFTFSCPVFAQQALLGKYTGTYIAKISSGERAMGLTLEITAVDGDIVKGKAFRTAFVPRPPCNGNYPMEGKLKGDSLVLRATEKGGPLGDCTMTLRLTVEGDKLVGTMNGVKARLSK